MHCIFRVEPTAPPRSAFPGKDCCDSGGAAPGQSSTDGRTQRESPRFGHGSSVAKFGALLVDCSSNGTFVNGKRATSAGIGTALWDGDRVSLVLSVSPLVELYFIYHEGVALACMPAHCCCMLPARRPFAS